MLSFQTLEAPRLPVTATISLSANNLLTRRFTPDLRIKILRADTHACASNCKAILKNENADSEQIQ